MVVIDRPTDYGTDVFFFKLLQTGESTPTTSGYFEVEVEGKTVHSKKVCLFVFNAWNFKLFSFLFGLYEYVV